MDGSGSLGLIECVLNRKDVVGERVDRCMYFISAAFGCVIRHPGLPGYKLDGSSHLHTDWASLNSEMPLPYA